MLDPNIEELISLKRACRLFPRRREGKRPHISCLYRWTTIGCRGVILESVQVGATRCTSREAIVRFIERLSSALPPQQGQHEASRRAAEDVKQELEQEGF